MNRDRARERRRSQKGDKEKSVIYLDDYEIHYTIAEINRMAQEQGISYGQMASKLKDERHYKNA
jgi:hypothetical protein